MKLWSKVKYKRSDGGKDPYIQVSDNTNLPKPIGNRQQIKEPTTSEVELVAPRWSIVNGNLIKKPATSKVNNIPLVNVSPEFDAFMSLYGLGSYINNRIFKPTPNSFTRGIGNEAGLKDLRTSGIVRGNPKGTAVTAKEFSKNRTKEQFAKVEEEFQGITNRWYQNDLSKEDFNALKKNFEEPASKIQSGISLQRKTPLKNFDTYDDYVNSFDNVSSNIPSGNRYNGTGEPYAYFYPDGRNPFKGYSYAKSKYGVRINNVDEYSPFIPESHLHPTTNTPVQLSDPNLELFKRLPFNIGWKIKK